MPSEVPEGWLATRLCDVSRSFAGGTPSRRNPAYFGPGVPWLKSGEVRAGRIESTGEQITALGLKESSARLVRAGTPVLAMYGGGTVGTAGILKIDAAVNQAVLAIEPDEARLDSDFCYYLLCSANRRLLSLIQGSGQANLSKTIVDSLEIVLPPLEEQRRIAKVLIALDVAIASAAAYIKQSGLVEDALLGGLISELMNSGECALSELMDEPITYGIVQPGDYLKDGVQLVRGGDFPDGVIQMDALPFISEDVARPYRRSKLRGGEIVVSLVGYPGACARVPERLAGANISRSAALLRPGKRIDSDFLYCFLRSPIGQKRILLNSIGSAQQVVNLRDLKKIMIPLPPLDEQKAAVSAVEAASGVRIAETEKLKLTQRLRRGVAADLLSGRVRVNT